jgi:hypothetical protein
MKSTIVILAALVLGACASVPERANVASVNEAADELECVGKCLEFGDESCQSCVDRCMEAPPSAAVAVFGRDPLGAPASP